MLKMVVLYCDVCGWRKECPPEEFAKKINDSEEKQPYFCENCSRPPIIVFMEEGDKLKFKQHIPNAVSGVEPKEFEFETLEELLDVEMVTRFSDDPKFSFWSLGNNCLMAVYGDYEKWLVVGYIDHPKLLDLPDFSPPEEKLHFVEKENRKAK